jgi:SAM-dependent methyltransferase
MDAYTALASAYDAITAEYDYDRWLSSIERVLAEHGRRAHRVLDIACGTGSSFLGLCDRGYDVTACDLSPAMLDRARARLGRRSVRLLEADMRRLPRLGAFDLVLCLDDSLNHLLTGHDLERTFRRVRANLAPRGVFVFDVNTLSAMRDGFSSDWRLEDAERLVTWSGVSSPQLHAGAVAEARIDVVSKRRGERHSATLRERHHPLVEVQSRLAAARLRPLVVYGQAEGVQLRSEADESVDRKVLFFVERQPGASSR